MYTVYTLYGIHCLTGEIRSPTDCEKDHNLIWRLNFGLSLSYLILIKFDKNSMKANWFKPHGRQVIDICISNSIIQSEDD